MIETIDNMIEIADYLNDSDTNLKLKRHRQTLEDKKFLLTVIGQFSAGKSRLINNLLEREVLPVHITETTAIVTFIKYGDEEGATIIYRDGSCESVTIEQSKKMWQSGEEAEKMADIANIHITLPADLLKNGLIIADTPGINTIIENHIKETNNIISNSDRILYVMRKPLTESDTQFIRTIEDNGVNVILVRTHMDEVKLNEENTVETIEKERQALSAFSKEQSFFVSNESNSSFYDNIAAMRRYLSTEIAEQVETALNKAVCERTLFFAEKQEHMLLAKKENLNAVLSGSYAQYEEQRKEIETKLNAMEALLKENRQRLNRRYQNVIAEAKENLEQDKKNAAKKMDRLISEINVSNPAECQQFVTESLKKAFLTMQEKYCDTFDRVVRENSDELKKEIQQISDKSNLFTDIPTFPKSLENAEAQNEELIDQMNALISLKEKLSSNIDELKQALAMSNIQMDQAKKEADEIHSALEEIQNQLDNYEPYKEKYIYVEGTHHNENAWRRVGNFLDWATILIPGPTWANLGTKVLNIGSKSAKAVKAIKIADTLADGARTLGKYVKKKPKQSDLQRIRKNAKFSNYDYDAGSVDSLPDEPKATILDYLGLDYWFAKIGKKFDTPDTKRLDTEYEKRYFDEKNEIIRNHQRKADEEYKRRAELLGLKSEQEKIALKKQIIEKKMAKADEQIKQKQKELEAQKQQAYVKAIKNYYSEESAKLIDAYSRHILKDIQPEIDKKMDNYINLYDFPVSGEIRRKRNELEELETMFRTSEKEQIEQELKLCNQYLNVLASFKKDMVNGNI